MFASDLLSNRLICYYSSVESFLIQSTFALFAARLRRCLTFSGIRSRSWHSDGPERTGDRHTVSNFAELLADLKVNLMQRVVEAFHPIR